MHVPAFSNSTVNKDILFLRQQAKANIKRYIDERLAEEYEKYLVGLTAITKRSMTTSQQAYNKREKIQALSLAKECYSIKLDLLTNATVVDDAIMATVQKYNPDAIIVCIIFFVWLYKKYWY